MIFSYIEAINSKKKFWWKIDNILKIYKKFSLPDGFIVDSAGQNSFPIEHGVDNSYYIVRTSSTIEDSLSTSCAGLFVSDIKLFPFDLSQSILDIKRKTDTTSIDLFLQRLWIKPLYSLNFLVQKFVYWTYSWVYFSQYEDQELIEFVKWPNLLLVDSQVNASKVILRWNKEVIEYNIQEYFLDEKFQKIIYNQPPIISQETISRITDSLRKIRTMFPFEVDVEWTFVDGIFYILQIRPICKNF